MKVCVIGAGPCGLTTIKNLLDEGVDDFVCHESRDRPGGIWNHDPDPAVASVYDGVHTISSKGLSVFQDFPMPASYPDFPSREQIRSYFEDYAEAFDLKRHIRFGSTVLKARPRSGGGWTVVSTGEGGEAVETADVLMVCNGHHTEPFIPEIADRFNGQQLHSSAFDRPDAFAGKRVLVVGGGNSACDIAALLSRGAASVDISMRRGQTILPKMFMGRPVDIQRAKLERLPRLLRPLMLRLALELSVGPYERYGLEKPDDPFAMHPTLNTDILDRIRHGKVTPRRGIEEVDGNRIGFADGSSAVFDTIIWATGFRTRFPFFEDGFPAWRDTGEVPLYLKMMPADRADLFFIGLIQPVGCIWALADIQASLAAREIAGRWRRPHDIASRIAREADRGRRQFSASQRHAVEVDFHDYRRMLRSALAAGATI